MPEDTIALHKKLGLSALRPEARVLLVDAPDGADNPLAPLPGGSVFVLSNDLDTVEGPFDYIHVFGRSRAELSQVFGRLAELLTPRGTLWISWVKLASSRRREALAGDLNENLVRRIALTHGLVDVKVVSLDSDWAGLKLVHRKH